MAQCDQCGAPFNPKTWNIKHRPDCPYIRQSNPKTRTKKSQSQDKAVLFGLFWRICYPDKIQPLAEYEFHPERNFRFDWSFPKFMIAVEIDGGNRMATVTDSGNAVAIGRHTKASDYEKLNHAAALDWSVFRFTPEMLKNDPIGCCELVYNLLVSKQEKP